ncbi:MAG: hypothetical protein ACO3C1_00845 [Ilumatobacteraceae bacterium]
MLLVEFTIEPFTEGNPGQHVRAAVDAAEALGVAADFGPFGTTCTVPEAQVGDLTAAVVVAAMANGATHVSLHVERLGGTST